MSAFLRVLVFGVSVLGLGLLAGCGSGDGAKKADNGSGTPARSEPFTASIDITIKNVGSKEGGAAAAPPVGIRCTMSIPATCQTTINCPPAKGDPDEKKRCGALADIDPKVFKPVPKDKVCTQVYGGPDEATISGTIDGKKVKSTLRRSDGCEIARWDEVAVLWQQ